MSYHSSPPPQPPQQSSLFLHTLRVHVRDGAGLGSVLHMELLSFLWNPMIDSSIIRDSRKLWRGSGLISHPCYNELLQTQWLETAKMHYPKLLEVIHPKSGRVGESQAMDRAGSLGGSWGQSVSWFQSPPPGSLLCGHSREYPVCIHPQTSCSLTGSLLSETNPLFLLLSCKDPSD